MSVPEKGHAPTAMAQKLAGNLALQKAAKCIGRPKLAARLGIAERTLRSYLDVARRTPVSVLTGTADALEEHAAEILAQAETLRRIASA